MSASIQTSAAATILPSPDFTTDSDIELFEWMALGSDSQVEAHAAFAEFHRRHGKYLFYQCKKRYKDEAEEIAWEAFRRVYDSASKFDGGKLKDRTDAVAARRLVRAWVGRIVRWVAADHFANRKCQLQLVTPVIFDSLQDSPSVEPEEQRTGFESKLVEEVRRLIHELPEREQAIAWEIAHSWHPGEGCLKWSKEDLDAIGGRYGLTRENIRQIKSRLIRKLRVKFAQLMSTTSTDR